MGLYIQGIELPSEKPVAVVIHPDGTAYSAEMFAGVCTEYLADCKASAVPAHGRLGDLDALRKRIEENIDAAKKAGNYEWWYPCTVALDFALSAPTVIDAEEEEK